MLFHSWVQSTFCSHIIALGRWFTAVAFNNDQASYENPSVQFMGSNRTLSNTKDSRAASTNVFLILSGSFIQSEITDVCLYGKFPWNPFKKKQYEEILKINAVIFYLNLFMFIVKQEKQLVHLRFLSTDGASVPITTSAEVLLLGPHDLLERADIGSDEKGRSINQQVKHTNSQNLWKLS